MATNSEQPLMTWEAAICKCARVLCTKNWFKDESMLAECSRNKRRAPTHSIFAPPPPSGAMNAFFTHWHTTPGLLRNLPKTCREEKVENPFFFLWTVMTVKIRWTRQRVDAGAIRIWRRRTRAWKDYTGAEGIVRQWPKSKVRIRLAMCANISN